MPKAGKDFLNAQQELPKLRELVNRVDAFAGRCVGKESESRPRVRGRVEESETLRAIVARLDGMVHAGGTGRR